jgi:DUF1680 family protein
MDGTKYFYTNPLAASADFPYHLRWEGGRVPYISKSNCCPPNLVRTIAEVNDYMYSLGRDGLYFNLYGGNTLNTELHSGEKIAVEQTTDYPWEGSVNVLINEAPSSATRLHFRVPGWCSFFRIAVNGRIQPEGTTVNGYRTIERIWKKGDRIEIYMDMSVALIESNPLVEETRNQVAVKRGPLVYCLESVDLPKNKVSDVQIIAAVRFKPEQMTIDGGRVMALTGRTHLRLDNDWGKKLYKEISTKYKPVTITLIPYFAWANRGKTDMTVWMPFIR